MLYENNRYVKLTFEEEEVDIFHNILKKMVKEAGKAGFIRFYKPDEIDMIRAIHTVFEQKNKSPDES